MSLWLSIQDKIQSSWVHLTIHVRQYKNYSEVYKSKILSLEFSYFGMLEFLV